MKAGLANASDNALRLICRASGKQHGELVATEPESLVDVGAQRLGQGGRKQFQDPIAFVVARNIVDLLEAVEVETNKRQRLLQTRRAWWPADRTTQTPAPTAATRDPAFQNMLAAMLTVNARIAALNANESTDCNSTRRRIERPDTPTSAVCAATAIVKAK